VIIWSRWGILLLPVVGLGIATGFVLGAIAGGVTGGEVPENLFLGVGLVLAGLYVWLFDHLALPHLDRPRQQVVLQPLAQPYTHPNGVRQTHQQVPLVNPQTGQPVWVRPRSSLFFVPVRYWPFIVAGIGIVVTVSSAVRLLVG
jgi:hypothetical protein